MYSGMVISSYHAANTDCMFYAIFGTCSLSGRTQLKTFGFYSSVQFSSLIES
jgi:hypothetical protein